MKKTWKKTILSLLCVGILILSSCTGSTPTDPVDREPDNPVQPDQVAMGRYVEQQLSYPDVAMTTVLQQVSDRTFRVLGLDNSLSWVIWESTDAGESWQQVRYSWLEELYPYQISGAAFTREGGVYLLYGLLEADLEYKEPERYEGLADLSEAGTQYFAYGDDTGLTRVDHALGPHNPYARLLMSDNGHLVYDNYEIVSLLDPESGSLLNPVTVAEFPYAGVYTVFGDTYAISELDTLNLYDLVAGEKREALVYPSNLVFRYNASDVRDRRIAVEPGHGAFYYCDPVGIFRMLADGSVTELLVDGGQSSFGQPSLSTFGIYAHEDNSLTVALYEQATDLRLFRYVFDPEVPLNPTKELSVYSLTQNLTVEEAMVGFQREHPDVVVRYEVGIPEGNEMTAADALRTLSTQMLAGDGPDVLILDGIPVDSYIAQGALADLRDVVEPMLASGELLPNMAGAFAREDGAYYAVPARFQPMLLLGDSPDSVTDLASLVEWVKATGAQPVRLPGDLVMERFYDAHAARWLNGDGSWNEAAFAHDLALMKELADGIQYYEYEDSIAVYRQRGDLTVISGVNWLYGPNRFTAGRLHSLYVVGYNVLEAVLEAQNGSVRPFPSAEGGAFLAKTILGVNAGTEEMETATDFVAWCLSEEVLKTSLNDGLSVNAAGLAADARNPDPGGITSRGREDEVYITDLETGALVEETTIPWSWPSDAFMNGLVEMVAGLKQAAPNNAVLKEIVLEETGPFFQGDRNLEETLDSVNRKVELYLLEKE